MSYIDKVNQSNKAVYQDVSQRIKSMPAWQVIDYYLYNLMQKSVYPNSQMAMEELRKYFDSIKLNYLQKVSDEMKGYTLLKQDKTIYELLADYTNFGESQLDINEIGNKLIENGYLEKGSPPPLDPRENPDKKFNSEKEELDFYYGLLGDKTPVQQAHVTGMMKNIKVKFAAISPIEADKVTQVYYLRAIYNTTKQFTIIPVPEQSLWIEFRKILQSIGIEDPTKGDDTPLDNIPDKPGDDIATRDTKTRTINLPKSIFEMIPDRAVVAMAAAPFAIVGFDLTYRYFFKPLVAGFQLSTNIRQLGSAVGSYDNPNVLLMAQQTMGYRPIAFASMNNTAQLSATPEIEKESAMDKLTGTVTNSLNTDYLNKLSKTPEELKKVESAKDKIMTAAKQADAKLSEKEKELKKKEDELAQGKKDEDKQKELDETKKQKDEAEALAKDLAVKQKEQIDKLKKVEDEMKKAVEEHDRIVKTKNEAQIKTAAEKYAAKVKEVENEKKAVEAIANALNDANKKAEEMNVKFNQQKREAEILKQQQELQIMHQRQEIENLKQPEESFVNIPEEPPMKTAEEIKLEKEKKEDDEQLEAELKIIKEQEEEENIIPSAQVSTVTNPLDSSVIAGLEDASKKMSEGIHQLDLFQKDWMNQNISNEEEEKKKKILEKVNVVENTAAELQNIFKTMKENAGIIPEEKKEEQKSEIIPESGVGESQLKVKSESEILRDNAEPEFKQVNQPLEDEEEERIVEEMQQQERSEGSLDIEGIMDLVSDEYKNLEELADRINVNVSDVKDLDKVELKQYTLYDVWYDLPGVDNLKIDMEKIPGNVKEVFNKKIKDVMDVKTKGSSALSEVDTLRILYDTYCYEEDSKYIIDYVIEGIKNKDKKRFDKNIINKENILNYLQTIENEETKLELNGRITSYTEKVKNNRPVYVLYDAMFGILVIPNKTMELKFLTENDYEKYLSFIYLPKCQEFISKIKNIISKYNKKIESSLEVVKKYNNLLNEVIEHKKTFKHEEVEKLIKNTEHIKYLNEILGYEVFDDEKHNLEEDAQYYKSLVFKMIKMIKILEKNETIRGKVSYDEISDYIQKMEKNGIFLKLKTILAFYILLITNAYGNKFKGIMVTNATSNDIVNILEDYDNKINKVLSEVKNSSDELAKELIEKKEIEIVSSYKPQVLASPQKK